MKRHQKKEVDFSGAVRVRITGALENRGGVNLSAALADILLDLVTEGVFAVGQKFPNENILCGLLGVGRGALREAYQTLAGHGVIARSKSGTTVIAAEDVAESSPFGLALRSAGFYDIQEYRSVLEVEAARLAALRADDRDIAILSGALAKMRLFLGDSKLLTRHDTDFHIQLAEGSKNILLKNAMRVVKRLMNDEVYHLFDNNPDMAQRALAFHRDILDAVIRRNPVAAGVSMRDHMNDVSFTLNYMLEDRKRSSAEYPAGSFS